MKVITFLAGARPSYMNVFPAWEDIKAHRLAIRLILIHTSQHFGAAMSDMLFRNFEMEKPTHFPGVGSGSREMPTEKAMIALNELFSKTRTNKDALSSPPKASAACLISKGNR